jgi:hypothetical protein
MPRALPQWRACRAVVAVPPACALLVAAFAPSPAAGQMAGVPLLQSAFLRPGLVGAANVGGADDGTGYGAALVWGVGRERFAIAAGVGAFSAAEPYRSPAVTYGTRLAVTVATLASGRFAVTPFAGVGRTQLRRDVVAPGGGGPRAVSAGVVRIPAGVSLGYRRAVGARGTLAILAAPMYAFSRPDSSGAANEGVVRFAFGAEFGFATGFGGIGVTAGLELGQSMPTDAFGPRGTAFGVGLALARGRGTPR